MNKHPGNRTILFAGSLSASRSNALGVQMLHLAEPFAPAWSNCYWYDDGKGKSEAPNSYRLYTSIPHLWPFVSGRGFITRMTERLALDWWRDNHLIEWKKPRLRRILGDIGFAYVAPFRNGDATRCREILQTVGCPFVVHIWDFLDEVLNADYRWLFSNAEHVFCLSSTMIDEIRATATCETSLLAFSRPRSRYQAKHCAADTLKIGLIGTLFPYPEGPELLSRAISGLRTQFADIRLKYIGPPGEMKFIPPELKPLTECVGYLDDDGRDKALAECNVGYLPGPLLSPQQDRRSRHSIPSRSADYMAIGLPVIAAAHTSSATNAFFSSIRGRGFSPVSEPEDICRVAGDLRNEASWEQAAHACICFFDKFFSKEHAQNQLRTVAERFL
jgi:glycosyltransferase involved in cell wall biosynthesis